MLNPTLRFYRISRGKYPFALLDFIMCTDQYKHIKSSKSNV
jgi:hypothetical protein